jgi:hypothetical protein
MNQARAARPANYQSLLSSNRFVIHKGVQSSMKDIAQCGVAYATGSLHTFVRSPVLAAPPRLSLAAKVRARP